jgi:hypothetical protein
MVAHVVLFRPKPNLSPGARDALIASLVDARRNIPAIRRFRVGRRIRHGRGYEAEMAEDFPYAAIVEFDDLAGLKAYLTHPAHDRLGAQFHTTLEVGLIYDYELSDEVEWLERDVMDPA